jgi:hypothetical protein
MPRTSLSILVDAPVPSLDGTFTEEERGAWKRYAHPYPIRDAIRFREGYKYRTR